MRIVSASARQLGRVERLLVLLCGIIAAFLLITGAGWTLGYQGVWALSHLAFVPSPVRWGLGALLLVASILLGVTTRRTAWDGFVELLHRIPVWVILVVCAILFWLLRERTFSGDALLKLHLLSTETLQTDPYIWKEPLDSLLAYTLTDLLGRVGQPPEVAVGLLSVAAGVLYVGVLLWLARILARDNSARAALVISLLALGSSQLWFGHIENYSLVTAVTLFSAALAIGYLQGLVKLYWVGLSAGVAVSFHPQALFAVPALILLLERDWLTRNWLRQGAILALSGAIVPLLTVGLLLWLGVPLPSLAGEYAGDPQLFWHITQAFEARRLADALNNLWLLVPFLPLSMGAIVGAIRVRAIWQERVFAYVTLLLTGMLVYFFFFQNDLPRYRDWDLFALVGPIVALWTGYVLLWLEKTHPSRLRRSIWAVGLLFALLFVISLIGVNALYRLIQPTAQERHLYQPYRHLDLAERLEVATVTPSEPICVEAIGCERVARSHFTMPQNGDTRPVIFAHAPAEIVLPVQVPAREAFLWLSPALDPTAWGWGGDGVTFEVAVRDNGVEELLWSAHLHPDEPDDLRWKEVFIPLDKFLGKDIHLILRTLPGPANNSNADRAGWGLPWLMGATLDFRHDDSCRARWNVDGKQLWLCER